MSFGPDRSPAGPLTVRGGPGGTTARLEDLDLAAARLQAAATMMAAVAMRGARLAADLAGALTGPVSPVTWWAAQRRLAGAIGPPAGAVIVAARLTGLAAAARGASGFYRTADAAAAAALQAADVAVGRAIGQLAAVSVLAGFVSSPVATTIGLAEMAMLAGLADDERLLELLAAHPDVVEHAVAATPSVIDGALSTVPVVALSVAAVTGMPAVPADLPGAARWLGRLTAGGPWLRESPEVAVVARPGTWSRPPGGLADVVGGLSSLDPHRGSPPGTVRVVGVARPDGRRAWIVHIPGTQDWSPRAGSNPMDLTGNVRGMAGEGTAGRLLVESALRTAGARAGEPVLLAGHSQGGIVAAHLAADPAFRASYQVTHVVSAGAPVGSVRVPGGVKVLSLEHDEDFVPRLDGVPNPDRAGWVTVSRSTVAPGGDPNPSIGHDLSSYTRTAAAVDAATDPGLARWRQGLEPFLAAPGVTATSVEVTGRRVP